MLVFIQEGRQVEKRDREKGRGEKRRCWEDGETGWERIERGWRGGGVHNCICDHVRVNGCLCYVRSG